MFLNYAFSSLLFFLPFVRNRDCMWPRAFKFGNSAVLKLDLKTAMVASWKLIGSTKCWVYLFCFHA